MPIITLEGPVLDRERKNELVKGFTEAASKILTDIPKESFIVVIKENSDENIGVGGELLDEFKKRQE